MMGMENTAMTSERVLHHSETATEPRMMVWNIDDIARFYGRSPRWAERLVKDEEFPKPLRGDKKRWLASHVLDFATGVTIQITEQKLKPVADEKLQVRINRSSAYSPAKPKNETTSKNARKKVGAR